MSVSVDLMINLYMTDTVYLCLTIFHVPACYMCSYIRQVLITALSGQMFAQIGTGLKVFVFILVVRDWPSLCVVLVSCLYQSGGKMGNHFVE